MMNILAELIKNKKNYRAHMVKAKVIAKKK